MHAMKFSTALMKNAPMLAPALGVFSAASGESAPYKLELFFFLDNAQIENNRRKGHSELVKFQRSAHNLDLFGD